MQFGQYELRELIAVGGMAEVYKGRVVGAEGFEKYVAIKRILPDLSEDERFVKMLLTEARIHSALSHRNIVQIHDLGISEDGEYFIVLEYVEGYDLRMILEQLVASGDIIPEALSLHIASEIAQGLHFAHEQRGADGQPLGLVHRDVSPSNLLISMAGEVKLSDFGLAKRRHDRSVVGSLKGNLTYMSPEQARQAPLDRRTDVFSLGAVLFEMLTGQRLREIRDEVSAFREVASGHVPSVRAARPDLPEAFERLLARALAPDPEGRFADAAAFGAAIRGVLASMNTPVGASDLQQLLSTLKPARRPRELVPERSKVIRLGPEAQALGEAIAAPLPARPAPAPGMTPPVPRAPGGITNLVDLPGAGGDADSEATTQARSARNGARAAEASPRPLATPPPAAPLPPVQPWRSTPRAQLPAPRGTPPAPFTAAGAPARLHSLASASAAPVVTANWGGAATAAAVAQRAPTAHTLPAVSSGRPAARPRRETARVVFRPGGTWRSLVVAVSAALLLVAGAVHLLVVPLDVLVVWRKPAKLVVTSDPEGAEVKLDGASLGAATPIDAIVRRDRFDHVLLLAAAGYRPARQIVRYDSAVTLSAHVRLEKEPAPTLEALPASAPPAPATDTPTPAPTQTTAAKPKAAAGKVAKSRAARPAKLAPKAKKRVARRR